MPSLTLVADAADDQLLERSEPAREILGRMPHWTLRYGLGGLAALFVLAAALAWWVRYPDVLHGRVTITSDAPPIPIYASSSGRIAQLLVEDGQQVVKDESLAWLHSSADPVSIDGLSRWLNALPQDFSGPLSAEIVQPPVNHALGEVQTAYAAFKRAFDDHHYLQLLDPVRVESTSIQAEIAEMEILLATRYAQRDALDQELALIEQSRQRVAVLAKDGLVAKDLLTQSDQTIARATYSREVAEADIASTRVDLTRLERQLTQLQLKHSQQSRDRQTRLEEARRQLLGAIAEWNHRYRIRAPRAGQISFNRVWTADQMVQNGEEILTVVPEVPQSLFGRVSIPSNDSGKVAIGDTVMLRLDRYPYDEYGALEATVSSVAVVPRDGQYLLSVALNDGLTTTAGKTLPAAAELHGEARVVTKNRRLLGRLFRRG